MYVRTDVSAILLVIHYHFDGNSVVEDDTWKPNRTFIDDHFWCVCKHIIQDTMDTVITVNHRVCHSPTFSSFLALKRQLHDPSWNHHERQWSVQSWLEVSSSHVCLASKNLMGRCTNTKWEYQVTNMPSIGDWASNWKKNQLRKYAPVYRRIAIPVLGLQWIMKKKNADTTLGWTQHGKSSWVETEAWRTSCRTNSWTMLEPNINRPVIFPRGFPTGFG
jgi:hypothetical protein